MTKRQVSILVVDKDAEVRSAFVELLESVLEDLELQFEVDTATDGDEAYKKIVAFDYDVVITDIEIPRMNGLQLARAILGMRKDLKIMMLSEGEPPRVLEAIRKITETHPSEVFFFRKGGLVVLRKIREIFSLKKN